MAGEPRASDPTAGIDLVAVGPERAAEIAALHGELFEPGWDGPSIASLAAQPGAITLLAVAGTMTAGFLLARRAADEAEILSIGVRPAMQRRGLGRGLVETFVAGLREEGSVHRLFLEVAADNAAARALYQRTGFREVGRRARYYSRPNGAADALVLALAI